MSEATIIGRNAMGRPIRRTSPYERVMRQAERRGSCLEFTGLRNRSGYGRLARTLEGETLAHRIVWRHHHPGEPPPEVVMHRCDNPPCVEITHLRAGTHATNTADMVAKGRLVRTFGVRSGRAKLTDEQVRAIRQERSAGATTVALAAQYGVHPSHISRITRGLRRGFLVSSVEELERRWT